MRATFYSFETVRKALMASQVAIDVTNQNVSNVNTEGYARQRVDLTSISADMGPTKFARTSPSAGQGVDLGGISQIRDQFIDIRYRKQYAQYGEWSSKLSFMTDIENAIDEVSTDGLNTVLSNFYDQLQSFSLNADSIEYATTFRSAASKVTQILNQYSGELADVQQQYIFNTVTDVADLNRAVQSISELNDQIKGMTMRGTVPNELFDQRNLLMDKLANLCGATFENAEYGQINVKLGDRYLLGTDNVAQALEVDTSGSEVAIKFSSDSTPADIATGGLKGYLAGLNGKGIFANGGEDDYKGIAYYQQSLDALAKSFADTFNTLNYKDGDKFLFTSSDGGDITAKSIRISDEWLKDAQFVTRSTIDDEPGTTPGTGKNDNLLKMIEALNAKQGITSFFSGTFEEFSTSLIGEMGVDVKYCKDMTDSANAVVNTLAKQKESVMGVSIDEEGVNMVKYQKSYNAAARLMTVMDEMLDTLISKMGLVGR